MIFVPNTPWRVGRYVADAAGTEEGPIRIWDCHGAIVADLPLDRQEEAEALVERVNLFPDLIVALQAAHDHLLLHHQLGECTRAFPLVTAVLDRVGADQP